MTLFGMTLFCIADLASGPVTVKARLADSNQDFHVGRYQASIPTTILLQYSLIDEEMSYNEIWFEVNRSDYDRVRLENLDNLGNVNLSFHPNTLIYAGVEKQPKLNGDRTRPIA